MDLGVKLGCIRGIQMTSTVFCTLPHLLCCLCIFHEADPEDPSLLLSPQLSGASMRMRYRMQRVQTLRDEATFLQHEPEPHGKPTTVRGMLVLGVVLQISKITQGARRGG